MRHRDFGTSWPGVALRTPPRTRSVIPLAAMTGVLAMLATGCGGSTKTVVSIVTTPVAAPTTTSSAPSGTSSTSSGPPDCSAVTTPTDRSPVLCQAQGQYYRLATDNHPIRLKGIRVQFVGARTTSSVSDSSGVASATAHGTFLIITLRVTKLSSSPQTVESVGGNSFQLSTTGKGSKTFSESFQAENTADSQSFLTQNSSPLQPDESKTGDVVFDVSGPGLAAMRAHGAVLVFGSFGTDLTNVSSDASNPAGLLLIYHKHLQG